MMNFTFKTLLLLFSFIISTGLCAQTSGEVHEELMKLKLPSTLPPAPNAASLGKFGDIPVSEFTGSAAVSLPLYNIKVGSLNLPVTANYHTGGIKVEEIASDLGLGWALTTGGVISKTIRGMEDNLPGGYLYNNGESAIKVKQFANGEMTDTEAQNFQYLVAKGYLDTEPDQFTFNFSNFSGKFVYNSNLDIVVHPYENLKIVETSTGFKITAPDGIKYIFEDIETTNVITKTAKNGSINPYIDGYQYTSSWYLTKIITPGGEEVNYTYFSLKIQPEYIASETKYFRHIVNVPLNCIPTQPFEKEFTILNWLETETFQKKISQITYPNGKINFTYKNLGRLDLPGDRALDKIIISNNTRILKSFNFGQNYFNSRLFLSSVTEEGQGESHPPYKFEYYNPEEFPPRNSKSQDFWGYFNGQSGNNTLIPASFEYSDLNPAIPPFAGGANREPNAELVKTGVLKKMTYPTGGYTSFEYEIHEVGNLEGKKDILDTIRSITTEPLFFSAPPTANITEQIINISHSQVIHINSQLSGYNTYVRVYDATGNGIYEHTAPNTGDVQSKNLTISVTPGDYRIVGFNYEEEFTVSLSFSYKKESSDYQLSKNRIVGGLRIKNISDYNSNCNLISKKRYDYKMNNENDRSSGILVSSFVNEYFTRMSALVDCSSYTTVALGQYWVRTANSAAPMTFSQGSHVEYSEVEIIQGDGNQNGINRKAFTSSKNYPDFIYKRFPFLLASDRSYARGKIWKEEVYKTTSDGLYKLIKEQENIYQNKYGNFLSSPTLVIGFDEDYSILEGNSPSNTYISNNSAHTSQLLLLQSTRTLDWNEQGDAFVENVTNYSYENPQHLQVTSVETKNSKNENIRLNYFYPDDVIDEFSLGEPLTSLEKSAIDMLKSENLHNISIPVQVEKILNDTKIIQRTNFKEWKPDLILPVEIKSSKSPDNLISRIHFHRYDNTGNIVEQSMENGPTIVYIFGYEKQFPIAKIENATYTEVASALNITLEQLDAFNESNISSIDNLRNISALTNAMVTTYIYQPLVGISSIKNPKGDTVTYHYDIFDRLEFIKDKEGKILQEFKYKYKSF